MEKKLATILLALCLSGSMGACEKSSDSPQKEISKQEEGKEPLDLTGTWTQENAGDSYQEAVITDDTINIYWISDSDSTRSIYWAGTYKVPSESVDGYEWTSERDAAKTDFALLASPDDTKNFTYKDGKISYEVSMLGTTATMHLIQTSEYPPEYYTDSETEVETVDVPEKSTANYENDTLTTKEATIKITGYEVVQSEYSSAPYTLIVSFDFTNNTTELLQPVSVWSSHFVLTQETESTVEQLGSFGGLFKDSALQEASDMFYTDIKPDATVQVARTYAIENISYPVTLTVSDNYRENVLGTKVINLQ